MRDKKGALCPYYFYELRDSNGKLKKKSRKKISKSFLIAYAKWLHAQLIGTSASTNTTDTGGSARASSFPWTSSVGLNCTAASGTATNGVVVGTGTNAISLSDTKLQTQIAHGTGSGQLQYAASVCGTPVQYSSLFSYFNLTRVFTNASAGTVTINEIGVYATFTHTFCIIRDLTTIAMASGDQLTLNYEIQATV